MVVGDDMGDLDPVAVPRAGGGDVLFGLPDLLVARREVGPVDPGPAVELGVRELHPVGAERDRQVGDLAEALDIGAVQHGVDGERQSGAGEQGGRGELALVPGGTLEPGQPGDAVGLPGVGVLDGQLHVVQPGRGEFGGAVTVQRQTAGDQVGVEAELPGVRDDGDQIAAEQRLAAGEVDLEHTEPARLVEHPQPLPGVQFLPLPDEFDRVGAVVALQGAAVGEFGDQAERGGGALAGRGPGQSGGRVRVGRAAGAVEGEQPPIGEVGQQGEHLAGVHALVLLGEPGGDLGGVAPSVAVPQHGGGGPVEQQHALRVEQGVLPADRVVDQPHPAPQPGGRGGGCGVHRPAPAGTGVPAVPVALVALAAAPAVAAVAAVSGP